MVIFPKKESRTVLAAHINDPEEIWNIQIPGVGQKDEQPHDA
jgi:hypothetical protein